jgi:hypothetical protein
MRPIIACFCVGPPFTKTLARFLVMTSIHQPETLLQELLARPKILRSSLDDVPNQQGVYILWLNGVAPVCLKIGIAGPRRGKGLRERIGYHYSSNLSNSVLAQHLALDSESRWCAGRDFTNRQHRQCFLADQCYFQVLPLDGLIRRDLETLETFLVARLKPKYAGRIKKHAP